MQRSVPHYKKLYEILRKHIENGVYAPGDLLPSENELCTVYKVTRPTVRHALENLVYEGFIVKQQGKGSIVRSFPKNIGILSIEGTTQAIGRENLQTQIITKPSVINWPEPFFFPLSGVERETGCIFMERLRIFNHRPLFVDINYLPNINLSRFCSRSFENKSLFEVLRVNYGIEVTGGEQRIRAIVPSERIVKLLSVKKTQPILHLERKIATNRHDFFIYSSIFYETSANPVFGSF